MWIKTCLFNYGCIKHEFSQVYENKLHPYSHLNQQAPALSINSKLAFNELAFQMNEPDKYLANNVIFTGFELKNVDTISGNLI